METDLEFKIHTNLLNGKKSCYKVPQFIKLKNFERTVIFCDGNLLDNSSYTGELIEAFRKKYRYDLVEFREKFEPTYEYLDRERGKFGDGKNANYDCIIAIGGGSCIDAAKGFATIATNPKPALEYRGFPQNLNPSIPVIAVPSTAGTGTELAFNAVFIDSAGKVKLGINTENNYPVLAVHDPYIIAGSPKNVIISSGLDALVHTLESFVSKKSNHLSRFFSRKAFQLLINNLSELASDPENLEYASNMQLGAYIAMAALSNSTAGPAGGMSYLLGSEYSVPHGIAGAVFIGRVSRFNHNAGYFDYWELYDQIEGKKQNNLSNEQKSEYVVQKIEALLKELEIPEKLNIFGVTEKDYDKFFNFASVYLKTVFSFNPVTFSEDELKTFIKELY